METTLIEQYTAFLEQVLTPARLRHSQGVMQVMGELAAVYALDPLTARVTGLLHDAAKDLAPEEQARLAEAAGVVYRHPCECDYNLYLHGPVGAYYVQKMLGVSEPAVLDAIRQHTWVETKDEVVAPLAWCVRFADVLEPYRVWDGRARILRDGLPALRTVVYSGRLAEAAVMEADLLVRFFEAKGSPVHPNHYRARDGAGAFIT